MTLLAEPVYGPHRNLALNPAHCVKVNVWQNSVFGFRMFPETLWLNGAAAYRVLVDSPHLSALQLDPNPAAWESGSIYHSSYPNGHLEIGSTKLYGLFVIAGFSSGHAAPAPPAAQWHQMAAKIREHTNDELVMAFEDGGSTPGHPDFNDCEVRYRIGH